MTLGWHRVISNFFEKSRRYSQVKGHHRYQGRRWQIWALSCEYLREFSNKFDTTQMVYSGAWGKLIHEQSRGRKSRDTVPLNNRVNVFMFMLLYSTPCADLTERRIPDMPASQSALAFFTWPRHFPVNSKKGPPFDPPPAGGPRAAPDSRGPPRSSLAPGTWSTRWANQAKLANQPQHSGQIYPIFLFEALY